MVFRKHASFPPIPSMHIADHQRHIRPRLRILHHYPMNRRHQFHVVRRFVPFNQFVHILYSPHRRFIVRHPLSRLRSLPLRACPPQSKAPDGCTYPPRAK